MLSYGCGVFFFIKQLKLITTRRIQNHNQLYHRTTLLTEALQYTRVEFTIGSLLMVFRYVKSFRTYHTIIQTNCTYDFLSLIRQNQHNDMTTFTDTLADKCLDLSTCELMSLIHLFDSLNLMWLCNNFFTKLNEVKRILKQMQPKSGQNNT